MVDNPQPWPPKMPEIDMGQVSQLKFKNFVLDVYVDQQGSRYFTEAMNLESLVAQIAVATYANLPRISGWRVFDESGILLLNVATIAFLAQLGKMTPLGKQTAESAAGFRVMPVVTGVSKNFQDDITMAKKEGRA